MQIKTTMRVTSTPTRMVITQKTDNNKCCQGYGEIATLAYCWWECKMMQPLWKWYDSSSEVQT